MTVPVITKPPSHITLPSGDRMPSIGLGCWQAPSDQLADAVDYALKVGYRHVDGAVIYGNEEAMGQGIKKSGVPRKDIWITTKLWNTDHRPEDVMKACKKSLEKIGVDYVDLWLMHYPAASDPNGPWDDPQPIDVSYVDTYKAMEECVDAGLVRNIGVSNFSKIELENLLKSCRIKPALHQFERHPYLPQNAFVKYHKEIGLHITAYTPLGNTNPLFSPTDKLPPVVENPTIQSLAKKYGVSPANILISLQLSEGMSVLPKSVTPSRIKENLNVIQLPQEDIDAIAEACKGKRARYADFSAINKYKFYEGLDDKD